MMHDTTAESVAAAIVKATRAVLPDPTWTPYSPELTPGQSRLLDADLERLCRLMGKGSEGIPAVLTLLGDMADQAPDLDTVLAARRLTTQDRPTIALALGRNRGA